jgi:tight adherence protein B
MNGALIYLVVAALGLFAVGGAAFAFSGAGAEKTKKRVASVARPTASARAVKGVVDNNQQRRKNVQTMLKELEKQTAARKKRPSLRRRIEQAGLTISTRTYWTLSGVSGVLAAAVVFVMQKPLFAAALAGFAFGVGLPRWVLSFLRKRREKAFTREFANAIDVIVRSVKSGLPVNEALKVVASDIAEPVSTEFRVLNENLKVGVTMEDGLKRMFERMPTAEVNFFGIVMTIQQKTGGNLSEALQNLSNVLRDRKRMQGKIRAMSSEAKAGAMIIGSLPPGVVALISITSPQYIAPLFHLELGNLMLMGCGVWMTIGVLVMKKMVSFKI